MSSEDNNNDSSDHDVFVQPLYPPSRLFGLAASLPPRAPRVAHGKWNKELFGSVCTELVPEHMVDLKDELSGRDAGLLYRFWPSAKRAKRPFSIMLPGQVRRGVVGERVGGVTSLLSIMLSGQVRSGVVRGRRGKRPSSIVLPG